jgi:hypothetical protein
VTFAVIALVLAGLITASAVAAEVVASYRRIGVLEHRVHPPVDVDAAYTVRCLSPLRCPIPDGDLFEDW